MSIEPPILIIRSANCRKFRPQHVAAKPGWAEVPAVREVEWHEIESPLILQSGPAAFTDGLDALHPIIMNWSRAHA